MTIGIAATCDYRRSIILASDQMISAGDYSGDRLALKIGAIHADWAMVFACEDISHYGPISHEVYFALKGKEIATFDEVSEMLVKAYRKQFRVKADAFLSRFGLDLDSFKKEGRSIFGETRFDRYIDDIERLDVGCDFLVAGFGQGSMPHIFEVRNPGAVFDCHPMAFSAIGSGEFIASSVLHSHSLNVSTLFEHALYYICEAKFMAEIAEGVGDTTTVVVLKRNAEATRTDAHELSPEFIDEIRRLWEAESKPKLPGTVGPFIKRGLADADKFCRVAF